MAIKLTRHDPEPVPLPPPTYSLDGMSLSDAHLLRNAVLAALRAQGSFGFAPLSEDQRERLDRIRRVLDAKVGP